MKSRFLVPFVLLTASLFVIISAIFISFLFAPKDSILASLPDYTSKEYYSCGGFQDTTDYAKYTYGVSESVFTHSPYFLQVNSAGTDKLMTYIENFENWISVCEDFPTERYDFDPAVITKYDYFYILNRYDDPEKEFDNYNIYFFDLESQILYFFHNNI